MNTTLSRFQVSDEIVDGASLSHSDCLAYVSQLEEGCITGDYKLVALCTDFFIATQLDLPNRGERMKGMKEIIAHYVRICLELFPKESWPHVEMTEDGSVQMGSTEKHAIPDRVRYSFQQIIDELRSSDAASTAAATRLLLQFIEFGSRFDAPGLHELFSTQLGKMKEDMRAYILAQLREIRTK